MGVSIPPQESHSPQFIGRYRILSEIGRGGFAIVYQAHDTSSFNREVAIKVLRQHLLEDAFVRHRFNREIATIAQLEDEAIVPVYDCGEQDGQPYIVMRLMPGGTLMERLSQGPLDTQQTLQILARLASAVECAHSRNIIHRDIKPANILFDRNDKAYLTDFGIARILDSSTEVTKFSGFIGTPEYASPEQVLKRKDVDWRSDIFSLGVIVFQMLTGEKPFPQFGSPYSPTPSIATYRSDLPPQVDTVLHTALAKEKESRYESASAFKTALQKAVAGQEMTPVPASRRSPTGPLLTNRVGDFEILNRLGEGGLGIVYRAHDSLNNRDVALKVISSRFFETEDDLQAARQHLEDVHQAAAAAGGGSAILPLYQVGEDAGRLFLAMPLLTAGSLADHIREGRLDLAEATRLLDHLAPSLDRLHQAGLVHGDIKPANILLDPNHNPVLSDFGMHYFLRGSQGMTAGGASFGTSGYWSPEQHQGNQNLDGRSDIYSLGITFREWFSYLEQPPPALEAWIRKATANLPAERYQTVEQMAGALKSAATRSQKMKRGLTRTLLLALLAVVVLGGVYLWGNMGRPVSPSPTLTPEPTLTQTPAPSFTPSSTAPVEAVLLLPTETHTPEPSAIYTPSDTPNLPAPPAAATTGGADLIAFVGGNEIWVANVDGSEARQLTDSGGGIKQGLQWTPDGQSILYITNTCVLSVGLENPRLGIVFCPNWVEYVGAFQISPDGSQVAISLNDGLYILPYDLDMIGNIKNRQQFENAEICSSYTGVKAHEVRWSRNGEQIAVIVTLTDQGRSADRVRLFKITSCGRPLTSLDEFPRDTAQFGNYTTKPTITDFDWNGDALFAMTTDQLHQYGEIYIYDSNTKLTKKIDPLEGLCCFQGFRWSPDGQYLLFTFQDRRYGLGADFYYVIFGTIGGDQQYTPLPLPDHILTGQFEDPQPVFRPYP